MIRFKIVIPSYNTVKWLRKTLDSVAAQTYTNFDVCVIDDASTQPEQRPIIEEYAKKYGWKTIFREKNCGAVANFVDGIALLTPSGQDVILMLDGDDWLYNPQVLHKLNQIYTREDVSLTYGQFITYPRWEVGFCRPPTEAEKGHRGQGPWIYSALRTFKHFLWEKLDLEDLKDSKGNYYSTAWDLAIMFPLIEMAGDSIKCIHDVLYVYNHDNPLNDHVLDVSKQQSVAAEIRQKKVYPRIVMSQCANLPASACMRAKQKAISWINRLTTYRCYEILWAKIRKMTARS